MDRARAVDTDELPVGSIVMWAGSRPPAGNWVVCDGRFLSRDTFKELNTVLGEHWGIDNSVSKAFVKIPDFRGVFVRGVNSKRADQFADPDVDSRVRPYSGPNISKDDVGSYQPCEVQRHTHTFNGGDGTNNDPKIGFAPISPLQSKAGWDATGGKETRPTNVYVNYIIKVAKNSVVLTDADLAPSSELQAG